MHGTLVLIILTVQSSYLRDLTQSVLTDTDVPDTIQWWIGHENSWRIRTYALDHDIHTHLVETTDNVAQFALSSAREHYGDVLSAQHVIQLTDVLDSQATEAAFAAAGLSPRLEVASGRFAFWKPDDARYFTQSEPR
jgi:hypothetical protein